MLQVELVSPQEVEKAATIFHRDGFVVIKGALTPEQLRFAQSGAQRVIAQQTAETSLEKANRGFARYSFGSQIEHPEWQMLIDLPTTTPILESIWNSKDYTFIGGGGDYSMPGAKTQPLHSDMGEFFHDPIGQSTFHDVPAPFVVINFLMVDFTKENGAIRFVPGTQRARHQIPQQDAEPEWMKNGILCAPEGTAVIRDVRCWHGGTANTSQQIRPMTSAAYFAPWFQGYPGTYLSRYLSRDIYQTFSPLGQHLCRAIVADA